MMGTAPSRFSSSSVFIACEPPTKLPKSAVAPIWYPSAIQPSRRIRPNAACNSATSGVVKGGVKEEMASSLRRGYR